MFQVAVYVILPDILFSPHLCMRFLFYDIVERVLVLIMPTLFSTPR
jgi:hypothetical protein